MTLNEQRQAHADDPRAAAISRDIINFRDFGGLPSANGGTIAESLLFRSGHLGQVSAKSCVLLDSMNFSVVADLRFPKERRETPSQWPQNANIELLTVEGDDESEGPHVAVLRAGILDPVAIDRFYTEFYRSIPFDGNIHELFAALASRIAKSHGCTLIHCSVGKDRTGIFVALIQHILGVPREAILADYMLTRNAVGLHKMIPEIRDRLRDRLRQDVSEEIARKMLGVEPEYLLASIAEIETRHGSVDSYLDSIGVDSALREDMRARLIV